MDYIKLHIRNIDTARLLEALDFSVEVSTATGEIQTVRFCTYHYCTIKVYDSGLVQFSGSVHKMWNSLKSITAPRNGHKGFNGNDLTLTDIFDIREHLKGLFSCDSDQLIFKNIEIGVNLVIPFPVGLFTKGLLYHRGKPFEPQKNGFYWQCVHRNYIIKAYDKGHQYGMRENVLRLEIKVTRMAELATVGLKTFADLNTSTLENAYKHLLSHFDQIVHFDRTIDKKRLTRLETIAIKDYSNSVYWMDMESRKRDRHKKKLAVLVRDYSDNLKAQIRYLIVQKCVIINRLSVKSKCVINTRSSIPLNITQPVPKICPITGEDISMQKDDSSLLSNTVLKEIEKTDPAQFEWLKRILLTGNLNKFEKDVYSKMSKQIRNRFYNNPNCFNTAQISLF